MKVNEWGLTRLTIEVGLSFSIFTIRSGRTTAWCPQIDRILVKFRKWSETSQNIPFKICSNLPNLMVVARFSKEKMLTWIVLNLWVPINSTSFLILSPLLRISKSLRITRHEWRVLNCSPQPPASSWPCHRLKRREENKKKVRERRLQEGYYRYQTGVPTIVVTAAQILLPLATFASLFTRRFWKHWVNPKNTRAEWAPGLCRR